MRGILIDPYTRTIASVEFEPSLEGIKKPLRTTDKMFSGTIDIIQIRIDESMVVDDEGYLTPGRPVFQMGPAQHPIAGCAFITGVDHEGNSVTSSLPVNGVQANVEWTDMESSGIFEETTEEKAPDGSFVIKMGKPILQPRPQVRN